MNYVEEEWLNEEGILEEIIIHRPIKRNFKIKWFCNLDKINVESGSILSKWGINPDDTGNYLRISSADEIIYEEKTSAPIHQNGLLGVLDGLERVAYEAYIDTEMSIVINDNQYSTQDTGIAFFLFDNNYKRIVDAISFSVNADGEIELIRV